MQSPRLPTVTSSPARANEDTSQISSVTDGVRSALSNRTGSDSTVPSTASRSMASTSTDRASYSRRPSRPSPRPVDGAAASFLMRNNLLSRRSVVEDVVLGWRPTDWVVGGD